MRSKKVLKYGFLIASFAVAGAIAACSAGDGGNSDNGNNGNEKIVFAWSDIAQSETTEAGSDYIFALPEVTANGEAAEISVTVKKDGKSVPNDGEKFYVEETGEYTIVYTAEYAGASEEKRVALKSQDTTAPKAVFTLPSAIKYDIPMNFGDKIRVKDNLANNLDESSVSYKLYDTTGGGERLLTAEFDEAQKQFVIENPEIKSVRLTVLASDKSGNAGSTSLDITMLPLLDYGAFDFSGFEAGALADKPISGLSFSGFSESDSKEIAFDESENKNILKLHIAESPVKDTRWATVRFTKDLLGDFTAFNYVTLRMRVTYDTTGGFVGFGGSYGYESQYKYALPASGAWATYRFDSANTRAALGKTDIPLTFAMYSDKTKSGNYTIEISEVRGGYDSFTADSEGVDLTEKFGLAATEIKTAEFTNKGGVSRALTEEEKTNFKTSVSGKLKITVKKAGYKVSVFETGVSVPKQKGVFDFSDYDAGALENNTIKGLEFYGTASQEITYSEEEQKNVLKFTVNFTKNGWSFVNFDKALLGEMGEFDYITMRVKITTQAGQNGYFDFRSDSKSGGTGTSVYGNSLPARDEWLDVTFNKDGTMQSFGETIKLRTTMYQAGEVSILISEIRGHNNT